MPLYASFKPMRPIMKRQTSAYAGLFLAGLLALGLAAGCVADRGAALVRAAWEGDARKVDALLEQGADANARGREGLTPLMASTWGSSGRGDVDIAQALVARGADVNAANQHGRTALHEVAGNGNRAFVDLLLAHGADANARTAAGQTPLMEAALNGHAGIVEALLRNRADPDAQEAVSGYSALMMAAMKGHAEVAALLVRHGADLNARDRKGNTALSFARAESKRGPRWKDVQAMREAAGAKE